MKTHEHAAQLAAALRQVSECLENWIEIAERDDKRQYDADAIDAGQRALDAWNAHNAPAPKQQALL